MQKTHIHLCANKLWINHPGTSVEGQGNGIDFLVGAGGKIGDGAMFDFTVLAEGLAEQDPVIGPAADSDVGAVEIHSEHNIITV